MTSTASLNTGHNRYWFVFGGVLLLVAMIVGTMIGPAGPTWWRIPLEFLNRLPFIRIDSGVSEQDWNIVWLIRTPRVVLAAIVGSMLSISGASYQGVFRNPLVDPYLLGVAAGAGLGATLVFAFQRGATSNWIVDPLPLAAFIGALVAVLVTYVVGTAFGTTQSTTTLILAGVAVTSLATSIQAFILQRNTDVVRQVYSWILGRLSSATWGDVRLVLPYVLLSTGVLFMHRRLLDVLRVGDDEASALGINVRRVRLIVVLAATLGTSAVVAVSGLIGFVGIIVPHAVRLLAGASYRRVLPLSVLLGAAFLVFADIPSRVLANPAETPIGVVTAFFGAPFFLYLLRTRNTST
ncbi:ABC transporter permease [Actinomycetes bacterium]|jgi:iron complex transport system permease protein|nr:ABC transporter permease [Actinomycetes bacterium]